MVKRIITILTLLVLSVTALAQDDSDGTEQIIHVSPYQQECVGVAVQNCLVVRFDDEDELSFFYDSIGGFMFEQGFEYTLLVNVTERENPPADASSLQYELVEVLQKLPAQIDGRVWELQSLNGEDVADPTRYTLTTTGEGLALIADCNNVLANLTLNPLSIETTISTLVACPPDSLDSDYLEGLNNANLISIENGELILQSPDGQLRFAPPAIEGIDWTLNRVLGLAMMFEIDEATPYTLRLEDGSAEMTISCNGAGAEVELDGAIIRFGEIETEEELCEEDPLSGMFPPIDAVYYVNQDGNLILEDALSNLYEFTSD